MNYENGPGNIPRMPGAVLDCLIQHSKVLPYTYEVDQKAELHELMHATADELLARLPSNDATKTAPDDVVRISNVSDGDIFGEFALHTIELDAEAPGPRIYKAVARTVQALMRKIDPITTIESCHAEALAMDLQFDIDVASALANAENAQDAARYQWVLPILVGGAVADKRKALIFVHLVRGLDGDAAVDAAMKADDEN